LNDEIERHEQEAARARERELPEAVFNNIPVMISVYDASGRLLRVNQEWERVLGWTFEEAQRVDILAEAYPDPAEQKKVRDFIGRAERDWADFRPRTRDKRVLDTSWARFRLSDGTVIGFGIDMTERKLSEKALEESEARFAKIFQASPISLGMSTIAEGRIIDVNESWLELFGYSRDEVIGRTNAELQISVDPQVRPATVRRMRADGVVRDLELQVRRKSGEVRDLIVSAVPVDLPGQTESWISATVDITDRKRAEAERDRLLEAERTARERLRTLSRRLLTAQEEERRHIAVELHDDLGQMLTAAKINLESVERLPDALAAPSHLREAIVCVDQALQRVRDLSLDLRPSVLDDLGLAAALRWYVDRFAQNAHLEVHLSIDVVTRLDPALEITCFRLTQEVLTNVARHAQATQVWFDLHLLDQALELRVRDDGIGFDAATARARAIGGASLGLLGMEERVSLVGGRLEVLSAPGSGTELRARFPMHEKDRSTI